MGTTKAQIEVDYVINENIHKEVKRKRKFEQSTITKERALGIMVENQIKVQKFLEKHKMTLDELLTSTK